MVLGWFWGGSGWFWGGSGLVLGGSGVVLVCEVSTRDA